MVCLHKAMVKKYGTCCVGTTIKGVDCDIDHGWITDYTDDTDTA